MRPARPHHGGLPLLNTNTMPNNLFIPFTFHADITGVHSTYKQFVEDIYNISGGMKLMLQIAMRSWIDQDSDVAPYLNDAQISNILQTAISINSLIECHAEDLIEWQNEQDKKKGGSHE